MLVWGYGVYILYMGVLGGDSVSSRGAGCL